MIPSDNDKSNEIHNDATLPYQPHAQPQQRDEHAPYSAAPQAGKNIDDEQVYREYIQPESYRSPSAEPTQSTGAYRPVSPSSYSPYTNGSYGNVDGQLHQSTTANDPARGMYQDAHANNQQPSGGNMPPYTPYPNSMGHPPRKSGNGIRTGAIIALALVIAAVFGTGLFAGWEFGHNSSSGSIINPAQAFQNEPTSQTKIPALNGNNLETVRESVVSSVRPAVVQLTVQQSNGTALGSGVIIDKSGYIVTNDHVVSGASTVSAVQLADGTIIKDAPVVATDAADDLAVVKINPPANISVAPIGNSSQLSVGQDVVAVGNPLGNTQTVTSGIISALNRNVSEGQSGPGATLVGAIQTDAPINPGNSGGALVNMQGQLIGIPTLAAVDPEFNSPANGVGFAIPSNRVQFIVGQVIQAGKITHTGRAAIGISAETVDPNIQSMGSLAVDHGVLIYKLVQGGAAQKAGMQQGDVIVKIDNTQITDQSSLQDALISKNVGDKVTVKAYRGNQMMTFSVTLGELQAQ